MLRSVSILSHLPTILREIVEFKEIAKGVDPEFDARWVRLKAVTDNHFYDTLDEEGARKWEMIIGITPLGTDTLEDRRFRIRTRAVERLPFTDETLEAQLVAVVGGDPNNLQLTIDRANEIVTAKVTLFAQEQLSAVLDLLDRQVPLNFQISAELLLNTWNVVKNSGNTWQDIKDLNITWQQLTTHQF